MNLLLPAQCDLVWQREFPIHPRLLQTVVAGTGNSSSTSLAMSTFRMTLESVLDWNVSNRENLYIYKDSSDGSGSIFYIRVLEFLAVKKSNATASGGPHQDVGGWPSSSCTASRSSSVASSSAIKPASSSKKHRYNNQQTFRYFMS